MSAERPAQARGISLVHDGTGRNADADVSASAA
jgi:hypothetical protein